MDLNLTRSVKILIGGLAAALLLVLFNISRYYLGGGSAKTLHLEFGAVASGSLLAAAALAVLLGSRQSIDQRADIAPGLLVGAITGCSWILEISFNNFVDPKVSTDSARFVVDNVAWAIIALAILAVALRQALRTRRFWSAVRVGIWGGLTSGLIACLMALLLVAVWMPALLRDPINIREYADRGAAEHAPDMATYFAYETMTGALGHLIILGVVMGTLLGLLGGVASQGVTMLQSHRKHLIRKL